MEIEASGSADDIRKKYASASEVVRHDTNEVNNTDVFDRMQAQAKLGGKSKITKRTYKFEG